MQDQYDEITESIADAARDDDAQTVIAQLTQSTASSNSQDSSRQLIEFNRIETK